MESVQDMSGCRANQKVKYTVGSFIGKALTWWNTQVQTRGWEATVHMTWEDVKAGHAMYTDCFHKLVRLFPHLVNPKNKSIKRNGSLRKNTKKKGNGRELSRDGNAKDDNKRSRTGRAFATVTNPVRKEYTGT
ncbi:hypothetical protein Tco_0220414, partial [Tanacetum coccineum]